MTSHILDKYRFLLGVENSNKAEYKAKAVTAAELTGKQWRHRVAGNTPLL